MLTVGELKTILESYEDDVEICIDTVASGKGSTFYEVSGTYDDEARPHKRGLFLEKGNSLPPL